MRKHWLFTMLLAIVLFVICFILFPTEAKAASIDDLTFTLNDDGESYTVSDCSGFSSGSLEIPGNYKGLPVTSIGAEAFYCCNELTDIYIPHSIINIGAYAFAGCHGLSRVTFAEGVTNIGNYVFQYCSSLQIITFPDSVNSIGAFLFSGCSSLKSITIAGSVTSIGVWTLYDCDNLEGIWVSEDNPNYSNDKYGVLFNKDKTELICFPNKISGSYIVPKGVTSIGDYAFKHCEGLQSVILPNSVTSIGEEAFFDCSSLTSISIPDSVTSIGKCAFFNCSSLENITIPHGATSIDSEAFAYCSSLESIIIPNSVTSIANRTFAYCSSLECITIPNGVVSIGEWAFENCTALTSINISDSVCSIDYDAFENCPGLKAVFYEGTESQKSKIAIQSHNESLIDAVWHYEVISISFAEQECYYCSECDNCFLSNGDVASATVTFVDWNGVMLSNQNIQYNEMPIVPADPTKSADNTYIYVFAGWDKEITACTGNETYTATYSATFINYTVTFKNWDGTILSNKTYHWGDDVEQPQTPTRKKDGYYTYTFFGWDAEVGACAGNAEYKAIFAAEHYHTYTENVTDPTCTEQGYTTHTCACGDNYTDSYVKEDGHAYDNACDTSCNTCGEACSITHSYTTTTTKAILSNDGSIVKKCSVCGDVASTTAIARPTTFTLSATSYNYDGKAKTPTVTVKDANGKTLVKGTDYTVSYPSGRTALGTYTVTITMKGNYSGTKKLTFNIKLGTPNVTVANATNGVKVSWGAISGAKTYTVYRSVYTNGAWSGWKAIKTGVTGTTYTDTSLKSNANVKYTVRAVNGNFSSSYKSSSSIKFLATPNVTVSNATNGVKVSWGAISGAKTYTVYRSVYTNGAWSGWKAIKTGVTGTSYTDTSVKSNANVKYTVKAINGSHSSSYKSSSAIKFLATPTVKAANAAKGVTVTWNKISGAKTYTVYRSVYSGGKWSGWTAIKTGVTGTSYTDTTVKSGATVRYTVKAINGNYNSNVKASNTTKFLAQPKVTVAKVSNGIKASWGKITGASGYIVYRRTYSNGKWGAWEKVKTTTGLSFTDTTAKKGVTYQYTVRAYSGDYKSTYTNSSSIKR